MGDNKLKYKDMVSHIKQSVQKASTIMSFCFNVNTYFHIDSKEIISKMIILIISRVWEFSGIKFIGYFLIHLQ